MLMRIACSGILRGDQCGVFVTDLQIINIYANDGQRIFDGVSMIVNLIGGPLLLIGATIYAIYLIGPWALLGFFILLLLLPVQVLPFVFLLILILLINQSIKTRDGQASLG